MNSAEIFSKFKSLDHQNYSVTKLRLRGTEYYKFSETNNFKLNLHFSSFRSMN